MPLPVVSEENTKSISRLVERLEHLSAASANFDFLLIDLRHHIQTPKHLSEFIRRHARRFFSIVRRLLISDRYCCILVKTQGPGGEGFPLPWSVALSARDCLKLRDEKIALEEDTGRVFYCLIFQSTDDSRPASHLVPSSLKTTIPEQPVPPWIIPKPPPRKKSEILHPAKYPETLVSQFIELFTKPMDNVLDPMVGTGSTVIASIRSGRNGYGVDLIPSFVEIAQRRVEAESHQTLFADFSKQAQGFIFQGDATRLNEITALQGISFHYAITSPPYWSMLTNPGSENQEARRKKNLLLAYSDEEKDLGNIWDYERFLDMLESVYLQVAQKLKPGGHLTVVVKNVKREHIVYPLAWDLTARLCSRNNAYEYVGTTLWCQDDVGIKPFAVGIHWVSNTLHHYCLHFRKRKV